MPLWLATVVAVVVVACLPAVSVGCFIQGQDSGECQEPEEFKADMEFCGNVVTYRACVPKENPLWPKHDVFNKDKWISETHKSIVDERIRHETNETLMDEGINELGEEGEVEVRFFENDDCIDAFKNYFCWLNFPRCDDEQNSLIMCRSACENLMEACNVRVCCACICVPYTSTDARCACCLLALRPLSPVVRCSTPRTCIGADRQSSSEVRKQRWTTSWTRTGTPSTGVRIGRASRSVTTCSPVTMSRW